MFTIRSRDTDLTNDQWAIVAPLLPPAKAGGRPRTTDLRTVVNAVLFLVKEGCRWRTLDPISDFPPWQMVYTYFADWRRRGIWRRVHYHLYSLVRTQVEKREPQPTALVIDTQSIKTSKMASVRTRGYDGGKKIKGRKRVLVTDTLGLLIDGSVVRANMHDTKGGQRALTKVAKRNKRRTIKTVFADKGFQGLAFAGWVKLKLGAVVSTTINLTKQAMNGKFSGFIPAKKRWVIERTNAWLLDYRRLVVDHERKTNNSMTMIRVAFIRVLLRRLYPVADYDWC